jgi:hypothetical protein
MEGRKGRCFKFSNEWFQIPLGTKASQLQATLTRTVLMAFHCIWKGQSFLILNNIIIISFNFHLLFVVKETFVLLLTQFIFNP